MNRYKRERFAFLFEKISNAMASAKEISEYYVLIDEWNNHNKNDIFDDYFLNSNKDDTNNKKLQRFYYC